VDLLPEEELARITRKDSACGSGRTMIAVSGLTKYGLDALLMAIDGALVADPLVESRLRLPQSEGAALAALEAGAVVRDKRFENNLVHLTARGPASLLARYGRFRERR
jgi:GTP-binding protein HflX